MGEALLPIIDVAVAGLERVISGLSRFLAIYWLPWLLGTIALLFLEAVVQDQLRLGPAPDWAQYLVLAPFAAMAYLMLLRWVLDGTAPVSGINLDVGQTTWIAALVVGAWFVAEIAVSGAPFALLQWLLSADVLDYRSSNLEPYVHAFWFASWLVKAALLACFFGLVVVVAKHGWPDLRQLGHLLRLRPAHLFGIAVLAAAAVGGMWNLGSQALAWLGLNQLAPQGLIPWRANIGRAFLAELALFPLRFLEFAIQGSIMAEAYRRLLQAGTTASTSNSAPPKPLPTDTQQ